MGKSCRAFSIKIYFNISKTLSSANLLNPVLSMKEDKKSQELRAKEDPPPKKILLPFLRVSDIYPPRAPSLLPPSTNQSQPLPLYSFLFPRKKEKEEKVFKSPFRTN